MEINRIFVNNSNWIKQKTSMDPDYFLKLSESQRPEILYIGCSDSRVATEDLMGVEPGEVFVHRNIANMVPNSDLSALSVINYAVSHLKVKHIVVCGHYECNGVKSAMKAADLGLLNPWLRNIRDVYRLHQKELDGIDNEPERYDRLVELNVLEQCVNVLKTADVQLAYREKRLTVHGWVWNIRNGQIIDLQIDFDSILEHIMEIYRLN
ncbi:MAG: carbonic anhydrase [Bacteroidales bacterium]